MVRRLIWCRLCTVVYITNRREPKVDTWGMYTVMGLLYRMIFLLCDLALGAHNVTKLRRSSLKTYHLSCGGLPIITGFNKINVLSQIRFAYCFFNFRQKSVFIWEWIETIQVCFGTSRISISRKMFSKDHKKATLGSYSVMASKWLVHGCMKPDPVF